MKYGLYQDDFFFLLFQRENCMCIKFKAVLKRWQHSNIIFCGSTREYYIVSIKMLEYVEACIKILIFDDDIPCHGRLIVTEQK